MRRYLKWFAAGLAFCVGAALAANLPFLTPQTAGSDFLPAINQLINQLNGGPGYTGTPQVISPGPFCQVATTGGGTCNGQRGYITWNSITSIASGATLTLTINNSFITNNTSSQNQVCVASISFYSGTFGTNGFPTISAITYGTGQINFLVGNPGANATSASAQMFILFWCV